MKDFNMLDDLEIILNTPKSWLITGAAGFIGSNIVEYLLKHDQNVVGLDNFSTGHRSNIDEINDSVTVSQRERFNFIEGDIKDYNICLKASHNIDFCLHQAALGSVPRSISDPLATNASNITGFLNVLSASKESGNARFVFAASSSTYGDSAQLPKIEDEIGRPLSPYAVTKYVNELYAEVFSRTYHMETVGLRYFNVFGARQDPAGAYAAVIPKWIASMIRNEDVFINGDGKTSRDFCYVENAVQANIRAAHMELKSNHEIYNVAVGHRTSLLDLFKHIKHSLGEHGIIYEKEPIYRDFRPGDVRHSQANIDKASIELKYCPTHNIKQGIAEAMPWYIRNLSAKELSS